MVADSPDLDYPDVEMEVEDALLAQVYGDADDEMQEEEE